jgi:cytidyltransferase-like protein
MKRKNVTVAVSGAFDPMHVGHARYIREAAKLGDRLVVILNKDDFLLRKKGFVFMPFEERKEILENVKGVDEVVASIDEDQTVCKTLEMLKPDIFAKGGEYSGPQKAPEMETCRKIGCKVTTNVGGDKIRFSNEVSRLGGDRPKFKVLCPYCDNHPILKERCLHCRGTGKLQVGLD